MDNGVVGQLREGEDGELIETRPDGKEQRYHPRSYSVTFSACELRVGQAFPRSAREDVGTPLLTYFAEGTARLIGDDSLSVIGESRHRTRKVSMSIGVDDRPLQSEDAAGLMFQSACGRAALGFNRADRESSSVDEWYLSIRLHTLSMQQLIDAVLAGKVEGVTVEVKLQPLYCTSSPSMPRDDEDLYVRPVACSNLPGFAQPADGVLVGLRMDYAAVKLPDGEQDVPWLEEPPEPAPEVDPLPPALYHVVARIEALRETLMWSGGLIVALLAIIAFKG